jgi:hypothetical protein
VFQPVDVLSIPHPSGPLFYTLLIMNRDLEEVQQEDTSNSGIHQEEIPTRQGLQMESSRLKF